MPPILTVSYQEKLNETATGVCFCAANCRELGNIALN
jgi:hypothetical protein